MSSRSDRPSFSPPTPPSGVWRTLDDADSEPRFRALVESIPDTILRINARGICLDVAAGQTRIVDPDVAIGQPLTRLFPHIVAKRLLMEVERTLESGDRMSFEYDGRDGRHYEARVSRGGRGDALVLLRDVDDAYRMRMHLMRSERLASVGVLAAGVAHEINNPLSYVSTNLEFVSEALSQLLASLAATRRDEGREELIATLSEVSEAIAEALEGSGRVRHIVQELKGFSRTADDSATGVDLARVLDSCLKLVANEIRHRARLVVSLGDLPLVHGNSIRLGQVFVNLLVNAAQSIEDGVAHRNEIRVTGYADPGGRVVVEVADTGVGIAKAALERIFDPFFTTKPVGLGTGLGLSVCHNIVGAYGGEISVRSTEGDGSVFRVCLRAASPQAPMSLPAPDPTLVLPRARVLIIDDEPLIGRALRRDLSRDFEVESLESARTALERISIGETWDVIICDMMMPAMSGMELFAELQAVYPEIAQRVVFMTGGAFTERAQSFLDSIDNQVLEKPAPLPEIRAIIASLVLPEEQPADDR